MGAPTGRAGMADRHHWRPSSVEVTND